MLAMEACLTIQLRRFWDALPRFPPVIGWAGTSLRSDGDCSAERREMKEYQSGCALPLPRNDPRANRRHRQLSAGASIICSAGIGIPRATQRFTSALKSLGACVPVVLLAPIAMPIRDCRVK